MKGIRKTFKNSKIARLAIILGICIISLVNAKATVIIICQSPPGTGQECCSAISLGYQNAYGDCVGSGGGCAVIQDLGCGACSPCI